MFGNEDQPIELVYPVHRPVGYCRVPASCHCDRSKDGSQRGPTTYVKHGYIGGANGKAKGYLS